MDEVTEEQSRPRSLQFDIAASPQHVGVARRRVADFLRCLAFGPEEMDDVLLAVGEACNNAISYAVPAHPASVVTVFCRVVGSGALQIDVKNPGNGFHPDLEQLAQPPTDVFSTHGRGFALMHALVDQIQVLSDGTDTIVRLTKIKSA